VLYPKVLPSICFTNKETYQEAVLVYIRRTRFALHGRPDTLQRLMKGFLKQFNGNEGFNAVRMLSVSGPSSSKIHELTHFVADCPGLRSFIWLFSANEFVVWLDDEPHQSMNEDTRESYVRIMKEQKKKHWIDIHNFLKKVSKGGLRHLKIVCLGSFRDRHFLFPPKCSFQKLLSKSTKDAPQSFRMSFEYVDDSATHWIREVR
jgi:hypothetical protein